MKTRTTTLSIFVLSLGLTLAGPALVGHADALAGSCSATDGAEMTRLREEMGKLAAKNAHGGIIRAFEHMLKLHKSDKCEVKAGDYTLAAGAARGTGDIASAIAWLAAGGASSEVADLKARFGQVAIKEKAGDLVKDGGMPFPPDERAAIEAAASAVKATGKFSGYLPVGKYTLGSKTFEVKNTGVTKV